MIGRIQMVFVWSVVKVVDVLAEKVRIEKDIRFYEGKVVRIKNYIKELKKRLRLME